MKWIKKGLIYKPTGEFGWNNNSALQPNPILLDDTTIRVYTGFRDSNGVSRVGYVDVSSNNPSEIIGVSEKPVLDIGEDGAFDEFGVVPSVVLKRGKKIFLYYAGYQLGKKVRFLVLSGLAISEDGGNEFVRFKRTPIFERTNDEMLFRVPHSILYENNKWKIWYGGGSHFIQGENKTLPVYNVRYLESDDGINIPDTGKTVIELSEGEYRLGRPYVIWNNIEYQMFYGYSSEEFHYRLGYAVSKDGLNWERKDNEIGIQLSSSGWDSEMMAYPSVLKVKNKTFLFYNGNNYGYSGFGYAVLDE